jgi:hypothetical protein
MIADSLHALSKRQPKVAMVIDDELRNMEQYSANVIKELLAMNDIMGLRYGRQNGSAVRYQQLTMTSLNNMALLLAESLKNMQQEQQQKKQQSGSKSKSRSRSSCENPGEGKSKSGKKPSSAQSAKQLQQELNRRLEQMRQQMKEQGDKPGDKAGKKPGQKPGMNGEPSMSEQLARSAAQQEAIRKMMQEAANELKKSTGKPNGELQGIIDEMEKTERDLVNKILDDNTVRRQQQIMTRLLEAEKAELKREQEEQRQSKEATQKLYKLPDDVQNSIKKNKEELDVIRRFQPTLRPYYKEKVQEYFSL